MNEKLEQKNETEPQQNNQEAAQTTERQIETVYELIPGYPDELINENQAQNLLEPVDQTYSSNISLTGIRNVYHSIVKASNAFMVKFRTNPPTYDELYSELKDSTRRFGNLDKILAYLTKESEDSYHTFIVKYYSIILKDDRFSMRPVYFGGSNEINIFTDLADEASITTAYENAYIDRQWTGRGSHLNMLAEKIKENKIHQTYFLGNLAFSNSDPNAIDRIIYERRILPRLKIHPALIYIETPHIFKLDKEKSQHVLLLKNNIDIFDRYEYFTQLLKKFSQKLHDSAKKNPAKKEEAYRLRTALEQSENNNTPEGYKKLAETILEVYRTADSYRQVALEVFLLKEEAEKIIKWKEEIIAAEKQKQLDLLIKRIKSRHWLSLIPASFYPNEIFDKALTQPGILGVRKTGASLGLDQDYYACIELPLIESLLKTANFFELSIIEEILKAYSMASRDIYKKKLFERKKNILFLILNPIMYFLKSFFGFRKTYIEDEFKREVTRKGSAFTKTMNKSLTGSGIRPGKNGSETPSDPQSAEKKRVMDHVMNIIFPDPSPSSLTIDDLEYRERLNEAARQLHYNPEFPQYRDKSVEAIMGDIDASLRSELIEDFYEGPLPSGSTKNGRPFTRKTFAPRYIMDQPLIYNSIREEFEHESAIYGSKDLVDYYRAKARKFTESSMENLRQKTKLRNEAERRQNANKPAGATDKKRMLRTPSPSISASSSDPEKTETRSLFGGKKKKKSTAKTDTAKSKSGKKAAPAQAAQKVSVMAEKVAKSLEERYVSNRKFSGANLYPLTGADLEDILDLAPGNLSVFAAKNNKLFTENFTSVKVGHQNYYFPKRFFASRRNQIARYYDDLVKHEESLSLPNGDILRKAHDIAAAIRNKK